MGLCITGTRVHPSGNAWPKERQPGTFKAGLPEPTQHFQTHNQAVTLAAVKVRIRQLMYLRLRDGTVADNACLLTSVEKSRALFFPPLVDNFVTDCST